MHVHVHVEGFFEIRMAVVYMYMYSMSLVLVSGHTQEVIRTIITENIPTIESEMGCEFETMEAYTIVYMYLDNKEHISIGVGDVKDG